MTDNWHLYLMAFLYFLAGIMHFIYPKVYLRIIPNYLPWPGFLVYVSGLAEIVLAAGICFKASREISIYGIIAMLILFLLVHLYMLANHKASMGLPRWILILRFPLQFALMYWAYSYL